MLRLITVGTGSDGNSYILDNGSEQLILDAGIPSKSVKAALDWNITGIQGVVVTHRHADHAKYVKDYHKMGIPVWEPYKYDNMKRSKTFGSFKAVSFPLPHDGVPCVGFLISIENQMLLYATDFEYIPFRFDSKPIDTMLVEVNYCESTINSSDEKYRHVRKGHASLATTEDFIAASKTDALRNVILCHLSDSNSDEKEILSGIKSCVNDNTKVRIASARQTVILTE